LGFNEQWFDTKKTLLEKDKKNTIEKQLSNST